MKQYQSPIIQVSFIKNNGGLNTNGNIMNILDNQSSSLQNVIFNKFGAVLKRNGFLHLNSTAIS